MRFRHQPSGQGERPLIIMKLIRFLIRFFTGKFRSMEYKKVKEYVSHFNSPNWTVVFQFYFVGRKEELEELMNLIKSIRWSGDDKKEVLKKIRLKKYVLVRKVSEFYNPTYTRPRICGGGWY